MKGMRIGLVLGCVVMVAACVPKRQPPPPAPAPAPRVQQPRPAPPPPPPPPAADWRDAPLTPGGWIYRGGAEGGQALFGVPNSEAQFALRCDRARRQVTLSREGQSGGPMIIRTTGQSRSLPVTGQVQPMAYVSAVLPANDRFLDEMLFSRGRIMVEAAGLGRLIIPSWPEPARLVEDCRS